MTVIFALFPDTRCFEDVVDPPLSLDGTRSLPTEGPTWNMQVRLDDVSKGLTV